MSAPNNPPVLAERNDIHKSCRSIESLLTVLNEYCEAAGAIVILQKKLSKALRETAGLKVTGEIAANAMNLSANIFEALSEVDTKFAKLADREYDGISTDVKKWFKKLTKEEKAHDERMAQANAKIKQAGQAYEKKSKKRAIDAGEEHARYINLISTLGPEISQDKYNHHLDITQRHTTATYNVAASLARLAEVEWQKSCECTRRFSPNIGPLGRWKVLCEGGWAGEVPLDLPNIDEQSEDPQPQPQTDSGPPTMKSGDEPPRRAPQAFGNLAPPTPVRQYTSSTYQSFPSTENLQQDPRISSQSQQSHSSAGNSPVIPRHIPMPLNEQMNGPNNDSSVSLARTPDELEPPHHLFDPHTGSVRSLSAFPAPPTHMPPPPPFPRHIQNVNQNASPSQPSSNPEAPVAGPQYISESPVSMREEHQPVSTAVNPTHSQPPRQETITQELPPLSDAELGFRAPRNVSEPQASPFPLEIRRPIPVRSETALSSVSSNPQHAEKLIYADPHPSPVKSLTLSRYPRGEIPQEQEFGLSNGSAPKARTMDVSSKYSKVLERTDTGTSTGSVVAALRNRYSLTSESTSPPPRELPKVPLSVNTLVSKYQPTSPITSPRLRAVSPPVSRQQSLPVLERAVQQTRQPHLESMASPSQPRSPPLIADEERRRQRDRLSDSQGRGANVKEQELRQREMELDRRAQELDRERTRLHNLREADERYDNMNDQGTSNAQEHYNTRVRERRTSLRRPSSQMEDATEGRLAPRGTLVQRPQYSYSATHLVPPSAAMAGTPPATSQPLRGTSQPPSPLISDSEPTGDSGSRHHEDRSSTNHSANPSLHASYCGCESCSVSKYKSSGQAPEDGSRQRKDSKPEKSKSWIRRLSMPVGNAFGSSGDSKKHQSNNSVGGTANTYQLGAGIVGGPSTGRGLFSLDGRRNLGSNAFGASVDNVTTKRTSAHEDGYLRGTPVPGRRGQETRGMGNHSATNLGLSGRH